MPTYDYRCKACHHAFEQFQSMKDATLKTCPSCGKKQLERLIGTGGAIIFKGSGFYITDYRSESYKTGEKSAAPAPETAEKSTAAKPAETATPSQPASKPAAPEPAAKSTPKSEPAAAASKSAKKRSSGSKR
jgi:putative FmdB family regulatory protein